MHSPGHLREAFQDFLDTDTPAHEFTVEHNGKSRTLAWLLDQLRHSTDVLPAGYCEQLDLPHGATYAQAARLVKARYCSVSK